MLLRPEAEGRIASFPATGDLAAYRLDTRSDFPHGDLQSCLAAAKLAAPQEDVLRKIDVDPRKVGGLDLIDFQQLIVLILPASLLPDLGASRFQPQGGRMRRGWQLASPSTLKLILISGHGRHAPPPSGKGDIRAAHRFRRAAIRLGRKVSGFGKALRFGQH